MLHIYHMCHPQRWFIITSLEGVGSLFWIVPFTTKRSITNISFFLLVCFHVWHINWFCLNDVTNIHEGLVLHIFVWWIYIEGAYSLLLLSKIWLQFFCIFCDRELTQKDHLQFVVVESKLSNQGYLKDIPYQNTQVF